MKEKRKKKNELLPVSAPIHIYLALLFISIIFIAVANYMSDGIIIDISKYNLSQSSPDGILKVSDGNIWDSIIANLGYGIFCSTIVAFLIDLGATNRQRKNDKKEFAITTQFLKNSIKSLITIRTEFDQLNKENVSDDSFSVWSWSMAGLCLLGNESKKETANYYTGKLLGCFSQILKLAKDVRYKIALLADNHDVPEDFFNNLDILIYLLELLERGDKGDMILMLAQNHKSIFNTIVVLFPEFKSMFLEKWHSQKMIEKYGPILPEEDIEEF